MPVIWELDFYSRPLLDENQKKRWEVLICERPERITTDVENLFRYAKFCASNTVNSVWLREAIEEAIAKTPAKPDRVCFFRRQMNNMISKAVEDAGLAVSISRRTLTLDQWLRHRMDCVYPQMEGYNPAPNPSVAYPANTPQPLPDALLGEQWAIVSLEAAALNEMPEWDIGFGEAFPLQLTGVSETTPIPGLIIYSSRATPLAAWMSGLELAYLSYQPVMGKVPASLILETGSADAWTLSPLPTNALIQDAQAFEAAKKAADGVHFLAIQTSPESESFAGFWLLKELNLA
ncbi:MAG: Tab2/Atab2 family RNA-binding protein [Leptolyngbyaceae bacterium]|nr:Tab2/Atab2 family RNA-binding protein [Leptolyngbyaceae bacterium]